MATPEVTLDDLGGWPTVLGRLASGSDLDAALAGAALTEVLQGNATAAQIAAFIFGLRCKGETVEEMTGLVAAMIGASERVEVSAGMADRLVDTCGTGGTATGPSTSRPLPPWSSPGPAYPCVSTAGGRPPRKRVRRTCWRPSGSSSISARPG